MNVMDVQDIAKRIGLSNVAVVRKAQEFVRLSKVRCPQGLGASESCRIVACLGLACKMLGEPFNKEAALKVTKSVDKIYQAAFNSLQNVLNVRPELSAEQLVTKFGGSPKLVEKTKETLARYKTEFISGLTPLERNHVNFKSTAYLVVAFYLTSQHSNTLKITIDKASLFSFTDVQEAEFNKIYASMNELCYGKKPGKSEENSTTQLNNVLTEKRRRDDKEEEEEEEDLEIEAKNTSADVVVPGLQKSKKRQKTDEYEEWKHKVLTKPRKEPALNLWRQSSLFSFVKPYASRKIEDNEENRVTTITVDNTNPDNNNNSTNNSNNNTTDSNKEINKDDNKEKDDKEKDNSKNNDQDGKDNNTTVTVE